MIASELVENQNKGSMEVGALGLMMHGWWCSLWVGEQKRMGKN